MSGSELPIFPLPLVVFPGAPQLLHIFEPRYRQMLADCQAEHHGFGISYVRAGPPDPAPSRADVGCEVRIEAVRPLADGRSNLLTVGTGRYELLRYVPTDRLYRVAIVQRFDDDPAPGDGLDALAAEVGSLFGEVVRDLARLEESAPTPPALPSDPVPLSFRIAAALDIDLDLRQRLLTLRSTARRLRYLRGALRRFHAVLGRRARAHERARRNGKSLPEVTLGR